MEEKLKAIKKINPDILKKIIIGLVCFLVVLLFFALGIFIGAEKAKFSYRWAESYNQNFGGPRGGFLDNWQNFPQGDLLRSHGLFGKVLSIKDNSFVIANPEEAEKVVLISEDTIINKFNKSVVIGDLKVDDFVVVVGSPNDSGQIQAKLIRVLPPATSSNSPFPMP